MRLVFSTLALALMTTSAFADDTRITLYSGNFDAVSTSSPSTHMPGLAQVSQTLPRTLQRGSNEVALDLLPLALDVGSVQLSSPTRGLRITGQRYDFSLIDQGQLLQRAIGQKVVVEQAAGSETRRFTGTLLAAGNGLTLQQDTGRILVLANYSSFELENLPGGLSTRPTLRWSLDSPRTGTESLQLDYATGGLAWQAEYLIRLDGPAQDGRMDLSGAAQVVNRSGLDFPATRLTLVAGSPNQARSAAPRDMPTPAPMMAMRVSGASYDPGLEAQDSGEYHAYPLPRPVDLPNGSVQRISLLDPVTGVSWHRRYDVGSAPAGYRPSRPQIQAFDGEQTLPVAVVLSFTNTQKAGLGLPLPNGRVRVFQAGANGDDLLGEARLGHTASGQDVELPLGEAFDLTAKRKASDFKLASDRLSLEETIEITLANAKSTAVTLRLDESLSRWQDWDIIESSQPYDRLHAQGIRYSVKVPAKGEVSVRYTVRYRWPVSLRS